MLFFDLVVWMQQAMDRPPMEHRPVTATSQVTLLMEQTSRTQLPQQHMQGESLDEHRMFLFLNTITLRPEFQCIWNS